MEAQNFDHGFDPVGHPMSSGAQVKTIVLCVGFPEVNRIALEGSLPAGEFHLAFVEDESTALMHLASQAAEVVLVSVEVSARRREALADRVRRLLPTTYLVIAGPRARSAALLTAMREGYRDWIDLDSEEAPRRLRTAIAAACSERDRNSRHVKLQGLAGSSPMSSETGASNVRVAHEDAARSSADVDHAKTAGEFRGLISQELDPEDLLRTALEYMLTKTGATNAAVFLPGSKPSQWGLGAYVNYDCPRATAEPLLHRLSGEVCDRLAASDDLYRFADTADFVKALGIEASVLEESELIAFPAHHGSECTAVFFFFRHTSEAFRDDLAALIDELRPVFAEQMDRIVRVHHRSKFTFPALAADEDEDDESFGQDRRAA
ncbi:MAG: hypothetical protein EXS10_05430 [Phycisphaerales bacterium]|nr:hypothetical protein [Phycisphaerales bacterium]